MDGSIHLNLNLDRIIINYTRRNELSSHGGLVLWGSRIIVSPEGRSRIISVLRYYQPAIVKIKTLARLY